MADGRESKFTSTRVAPRSQESPLALDGFCPVTLASNERWQQGDRQWGAIHRGRTYLFTSQRYQQMFLADPDRYSPMLSGYDPVRYVDRQELVPGLRQHGMWFGGKMYLFADEPSLERFSRSPEYFAQRAHDIMMRAGG
jgi:YHS domain-containing protein